MGGLVGGIGGDLLGNAFSGPNVQKQAFQSSQYGESGSYTQSFTETGYTNPQSGQPQRFGQAEFSETRLPDGRRREEIDRYEQTGSSAQGGFQHTTETRYEQPGGKWQTELRTEGRDEHGRHFKTTSGFPDPGAAAGQSFRGNFSGSARSIRLERGSHLVAECADGGGGWNRTNFDLNQYLTNSDGNLRWIGHHETGNFSGSSRDIHLEENGKVLVAEACGMGGVWKRNRVHLDARITNEFGNLVVIEGTEAEGIILEGGQSLQHTRQHTAFDNSRDDDTGRRGNRSDSDSDGSKKKKKHHAGKHHHGASRENNEYGRGTHGRQGSPPIEQYQQQSYGQANQEQSYGRQEPSYQPHQQYGQQDAYGSRGGFDVDEYGRGQGGYGAAGGFDERYGARDAYQEERQEGYGEREGYSGGGYQEERQEEDASRGEYGGREEYQEEYREEEYGGERGYGDEGYEQRGY